MAPVTSWVCVSSDTALPISVWAVTWAWLTVPARAMIDANVARQAARTMPIKRFAFLLSCITMPKIS